MPYSSAYSSLCVLPDGRIGLYVEEEYPGESGYSTVFYNFSLEWLTQGEDHFEPTGIIENSIETEVLKIYPMPSDSRVVVQAEAIQTVLVYSLSGQLVKTVVGGGSSCVILDVSNLPAGVYQIEVVDSEGGRKVGKMVRGDWISN